MTRFVIYLGKQKVVTLSGNGLSKVYRLEKNVPIPVSSDSDYRHLLLWQESSGCKCGSRSTSRPIMPDDTYCAHRQMNLNEFRERWAKHYFGDNYT